MAVGSTQYPGSIDTTTTLLDAANNVQSTLAASLSSTATSLALASASSFPTAGVVSIESEIIHYTNKSGNNLTGLTRGAEGTTAAAHNSGRVVRMAITATYHDALRGAVVALQTKVGAGESEPGIGKVLGYQDGVGSVWVDAEEIPGISVNTGSDPNAVKTNTASAQALLGSLDADRPTKTAAQIGALSDGRIGREIYQTDGLKGFKRDFGSSVGFQHGLPEYTAFEIGLVPNDDTAASANQTAWAAFHTAAPSGGAILRFPEGEFYFTTGLECTKPIQIIGAGANFWNGGTPVAGTTIIVDSGEDGITFTGQSAAKGGRVENLNLKTADGFTGETTGYGIWADCTVTIRNVAVSGFALDGIFLAGTTASSQNSDLSNINGVHIFDTRRDGLHLDGGGDTNVIMVVSVNVTRAGRHGIFNKGFSNTFLNSHVNDSGQVNNISATTSGSVTASASPQNVTLSNLTNVSVGSFLLVDTGSDKEYVKVTALPGASQVTGVFTKNHSSGVAVVEACFDYYDAGGANVWLTPYSEGTDTALFYLDTGAAAGFYFCGINGAPEFVTTAAGYYDGHFLFTEGYLRDLNLRDTTDNASGHDYRIYSRTGAIWAGGFQIQDLTASKIVLSYEPSNERTHLPNVGIAGVTRHTGTPQTLTGAGAVNLTTDTTLLVTTGANALTLADGAEGQKKKVIMITDAGDGTLTPTNARGFTTITFTAVGQTVTLEFLSVKWNVMGYFGVTIA